MSEYRPRTDDEIEQLAQDLWANRIFCDRQIDERDPQQWVHMVSLVFMPLALAGKEVLDSLKETDELVVPQINFDSSGQLGKLLGHSSPRPFLSLHTQDELLKILYQKHNKTRVRVRDRVTRDLIAFTHTASIIFLAAIAFLALQQRSARKESH